LRTFGAEVRNIVMNGEGKGTRLEVRFFFQKDGYFTGIVKDHEFWYGKFWGDFP